MKRLLSDFICMFILAKVVSYLTQVISLLKNWSYLSELILGHDITQVVFPEEGGETKSCTVTVTASNWDKDIHVPVKAAMDGIIDGMKTITITLTTKVENVAMITNVKSIQVSRTFTVWSVDLSIFDFYISFPLPIRYFDLILEIFYYINWIHRSMKTFKGA